jgi:predicted DNA-binding transcriptional regulator YafY
MIQARQCVPLNDFLSELEISKATFKRDLEYLRSRMNASIVYDRFKGGYCFDGQSIGEKIELPGLWFSEKEATALVLMQHLLSGLDKGGLIAPHIAPLTSIIDGILGQSNTPAKELRKRLKVFGMSARKSSIENFEEIGSALLTRKRLQITYYARGTNETTEREISPQRLIFYRDNWYLDAYCHLRKDLRSFSLDGISKADQRARLKFSPEKARWVSSETWHGQQVGAFDKAGNYLLEFDYNQDPELVMDILKYGSGVEVLAPASLRKRVKEELTRALKNY